MSDYLSSLVDITLNRSGVVKPRLPSMFEPVPRVQRISRLIDPERDAISDFLNIDDNVKPPKSEERTSPVKDVKSPVEGNLNAIIPPAPEEQSPEKPLTYPHPKERNASKSRESSSLETHYELDEERVTDHETNELPIKIKRIEQMREVAQNHEHLVLQEKSDGSFSHIDSQDKKLDIHQAIQSTEFESQFDPSLQPALQISDRASKPETKPTIHVRIGRIEVRAVMPDPKERRKTPSQPEPVLPLDKYLKQRRSGMR